MIENFFLTYSDMCDEKKNNEYEKVIPVSLKHWIWSERQENRSPFYSMI